MYTHQSDPFLVVLVYTHQSDPFLVVLVDAPCDIKVFS
uniref:Uncharacterized protein n=1 Tax=Anguilla anguilla TaxID=7936 RepID=A0A0E9VKY7_ANGAN